MSITECLSGPIFTEWRAEWADLLVRRIQGLARDVNAVKVEIQGCPSKEVHEDLLRAFDRQDAKVEIHAGVSEAVLVLEGRTKEDLWNNFRTLTKRSLKKGMAGPIHVRRLTGLADLQHAYESWMATSRRQKFSRIRAWPVIEPVLRHSVERGIGEVLASYHDSQLLASIFVGHIGNRSSYVYGGYVDGAESYRPTHILQYMAIQEAIDRRMSSYTFGELNEEPFRTGVDQFKLGFGAIPIRNLDTIVWPRKPLCHGIIQGVRSMDIGQALEKLLMKYKGAFAKT
jgi:lipid II:glycine glycyltransferase (peptidoglycan interpeptide bridge formation enzyme)